MPTRPTVSVVVPVLRPGPELDRCLAAIAAQRYDGPPLEVVVVDNDARPTAAPGGGVTVVHEPRPGSYAARNAGIRASRGEVVALTDADCIADPTWVARGVEALEANGVGVVAGAIEVVARDVRRASAAELYDVLAYLRQHEYVERYGFAATANLLARREVFETAGLFDETLYSNGDREWSSRVAAAGLRVAFEPGAVVRHRARTTLRELAARERRLAGGHWELARRADPSAASTARRLARQLVPPVRQAAELAADARLDGARSRLKVALAVVTMRSARAYESIRLASGAEPLR